MRKLLNVILAILIAVSVISIRTDRVQAREGFDINKHVVEMDVHEDGTILVSVDKVVFN